MKKMKVLFLARLYAPHIGGVEAHLKEVSQILSQKNIQVTIVTERYDRSLPAKEVMNGVRIWRISLPKSQTSKWFIWWWVIRHPFLFLNSDIIHVHDVFFWILPIYPTLRLFRKKIFMTFHGYEAPGPLTKKQIWWHRLAARLSRGNICVGNFHKKYYGIRSDITTYGGVSANLNHQIKKLNSNKIAFVGRLANDTGILEYLSAMDLLAKKNQTFHLDVFGDGDLHQQCQSFIDEHHLDVTLHGFVENASLRLTNYPIVFASQYLAILEAMSQGCAVVSYFDTPIKKDYLELTPFKEWITVTRSVQEIADAVQIPKLMNKHGVGWSKKQTWEKLSNEYLDLWK